MSNHYEWGMVGEGGFQVVTRRTAPDEWNLPEPDPMDPFGVGVTSPFALGVFTANGDGTVLEGGAAEIVDFADRLHAYVHRQLDVPVDDETRACAMCGDEVLVLSSRDWCDGCEATVIPAGVWQGFVACQSACDARDVSLSAVVDELLRLIAADAKAGGFG